MGIVMESRDNKYNRAKKRVKEVKDFYSHLTVYIVVNLVLLALNIGLFQGNFTNIKIPTWSMVTTPFFWGIGLFFHWLHVFKDKISFLRGWEERKIREYMEKEEEEIRRQNFK